MENQKDLNQETEDVFSKILKSDFLTIREKKILELRVLNGYTFEKIGHEFNITRERVRQIGEKIKRKLRENLTDEEKEEYHIFHKESIKKIKLKSATNTRKAQCKKKGLRPF